MAKMTRIEAAVLAILTLLNISVQVYRFARKVPDEPPRMIQGCFDSTDRYFVKDCYR